MKLPQAVKEIRTRWVLRFPLPQGEPSAAHEELCRRWSIGFAEQVAFELPGQGWGVKRGDQGRPIGKDSIALNYTTARLLSWDLMTGAGTGRPTLNADPESEDIGPTPGRAGQFFETRPEYFRPTNHLGATVPGTEPPTPLLPPASIDLAPVLAALARLEVRAATLEQTIAAGYTGTVHIRYLGTGQVDLVPKTTG